MNALLDADILVYRIGYTTQDVHENIAFARMNESIRQILSTLKTNKYKAFLTGQEKDNFRYEIDPEYKAGRTQPKPTHYQALRDFLIVQFGAHVINGMEADDAMGIEQTRAMEAGEESCIVSIDKDLDQIPGWHYNFVKGLIYRVEPLEGLRHFYSQLLQGDRIDNVKGLKGVGPKTAEKWLKNFTTEEEMYAFVFNKYREVFGEMGATLFGRNGSLVKIRTRLDETPLDWHPK